MSAGNSYSGNLRTQRVAPTPVNDLPMQPVPDHCTEEAKDITDDTRDRDERDGRRWIEWFDEVHRLDHVRPENEIENRLRPVD